VRPRARLYGRPRGCRIRHPCAEQQRFVARGSAGMTFGAVGPVWSAMCAFVLFAAVTIAFGAWRTSRRAKCKFTMKYEPDRAGTIHRLRDGGERDLVYFNVKNTSDAPVEDCTIRIAAEKDGTDEYKKYKTYIGQQPFQLLVGEPDRAALISLPRHAPNLPAILNNFYRTGDRWLNQAVNLTPGDYTLFVQAFAENSAPPPAITLRLLHRAGYWQNPTKIKLPRR